MALFSCLLDPANLPEHRKRIDILSPVTGITANLDESGEPAFQQRLFGEGALVSVSGFHVMAPFECIVEALPACANRIRLKDKHGLRMQIQCGMQSHTMSGVGFKRQVKLGQKVRAGEVLIEFDLRKIKLAVEDPRFAITILNSEKTKGILLESKKVRTNEDILFSVFA